MLRPVIQPDTAKQPLQLERRGRQPPYFSIGGRCDVCPAGVGCGDGCRVPIAIQEKAQLPVGLIPDSGGEVGLAVCQA